MSELNEVVEGNTDSARLSKENKYRLEILNLIKGTLPEMTQEELTLFTDLFINEKVEAEDLIKKLKEL
tara:strand:+ start:1948 stop:2151 length:204 start_codon:yes stop_codon:yes gene_type:complete